jgi:hypothetical protein
MKAYQYEPTVQLRHKPDPRNYHGPLKPHRITNDKATSQAQALVKRLGITCGTMLDGKLVAASGSMTFTLEPYYFGVPLDTPNGTAVSLLPADTLTTAPKGWNIKKLVPEGTLYQAPGWYGNGQWMIKGAAPEHATDRTKQIDDALNQIIAQAPQDVAPLPWSTLFTCEIDDALYTQAGPSTWLDPVFVKFIEQNTSGRLTYKFKAFTDPVFIYADGTLAALIMPIAANKMVNIGDTAPHKPARRNI